MYEEFYGMKERPFNLTPDPDFLYLHKNIKSALDAIMYSVNRREGFIMIVGGVGTGKTTLCWTLLARLEGRMRTALILNPQLSAENLLRAVLQDFGIRPKGVPAAKDDAEQAGETDSQTARWLRGLTQKELVDELNAFLLESATEGVGCVLVVDEAQQLGVEALEQLRILSNLETAKRKLLQIVFVGQLELENKLRMPQLRQLDQRITLRFTLLPLSRSDTALYVQHRLAVAGARRGVSFSDAALRAVYRASLGYPRLINIVCDRTLHAAYRDRSRTVTSREVRQAVQALRRKARYGNRVRLVGAVRWAIPALLITLIALVFVAFMGGPGELMSRIRGDGQRASSLLPSHHRALAQRADAASPLSRLARRRCSPAGHAAGIG